MNVKINPEAKVSPKPKGIDFIVKNLHGTEGEMSKCFPFLPDK